MAISEIAVIVPLWGDSYLDFYFAHIHKHHELFCANTNATLVLVTDTSAKPTIITYFSTLPPQIRRAVITVKDIFPDKYANVSLFYKAGIKACLKKLQITKIIFLTSDSIVTRRIQLLISNILKDGYRAINLPGIRIIREAIFYPNCPDYSKAAEPAFLSLCLSNLHPLTQCLFIDSRTGFNNLWPSQLLYQTRNSVCVRAFHLHPLFIDFTGIDGCPEFGKTIDERLTSSLFTKEQIYIPPNSDALYALEFSPYNLDADVLSRRDALINVESIIQFASDYCDASHFDNFAHQYELKTILSPQSNQVFCETTVREISDKIKSIVVRSNIKNNYIS